MYFIINSVQYKKHKILRYELANQVINNDDIGIKQKIENLIKYERQLFNIVDNWLMIKEQTDAS
jgi:hypothetical protein